jgi:adenylosuccinate lyase
MATENILMEAVKKGGDRQALHEEIRQLSQQAAYAVKEEGKDNDLLERILVSKKFGLEQSDLERILDLKKFIGRAPEQAEEFVNLEAMPAIEAFKDWKNAKGTVVKV